MPPLLWREVSHQDWGQKYKKRKKKGGLLGYWIKMRMNCFSPTALLLNFSKFKHPSIFYVNLNKTNVLGGSGGVNFLIPASLSPLAVITFGAYFLHSRRRWQWICEVYSDSFKCHFEGHSESVSCNKQEFVAHVIGCPKNIFFLHTRDILVGQRTMQWHLFSILHHLFPVILANTTVMPFVLLCKVQLSLWYTPAQKSAWKWQLRPLAWKITKDIHLCKPALLNCLIRVSEIMFLFLVVNWTGGLYPYFCTPQKIFSVSAVTLTITRYEIS